MSDIQPTYRSAAATEAIDALVKLVLEPSPSERQMQLDHLIKDVTTALHNGDLAQWVVEHIGDNNTQFATLQAAAESLTAFASSQLQDEIEHAEHQAGWTLDR